MNNGMHMTWDENMENTIKYEYLVKDYSPTKF